MDSASALNFDAPATYTMKNRMAVQFYTGLRAGVDSLNRSGFDIQLVLAEHVEASNTYRVERNGFLVSYSPEVFMAHLRPPSALPNGRM